mmetsp:Transcript_52093/g.112887  ORF Transcript_52093/g.112887 Transcript_52093/m.112887 type:complete len:204 (+) Transcript_52093:150-761(+)
MSEDTGRPTFRQTRSGFDLLSQMEAIAWICAIPTTEQFSVLYWRKVAKEMLPPSGFSSSTAGKLGPPSRRPLTWRRGLCRRRALPVSPSSRRSVSSPSRLPWRTRPGHLISSPGARAPGTAIIAPHGLDERPRQVRELAQDPLSPFAEAAWPAQHFSARGRAATVSICLGCRRPVRASQASLLHGVDAAQSRSRRPRCWSVRC